MSHSTIENYLEALPLDIRERMEAIRTVIHEMVPDVTELISYAIPSFKLGKHYLLHVGAWKKHIALYPVTEQMESDIRGVAERGNGKGTIQFPHKDPLPIDIVRAVIKQRVIDCT
jgi:uncharacterized protein YdhG (YjbR/CyaY superfamily)